MRQKNLPAEPGCYLFKDGDGKIIYVGKAKDLKKRVSSYFNKKDLDPKTRALVSRIDDIDYVITSNEKEAFILESNLIKKHQPHYNINLKDSKRYAYIHLTDEPWPRLLIARDKKSRGEYFGPFVSAEKRDALIRFTNNVFGLRTCKRLRKKACLRYHMARCSAPCLGEPLREEYMGRVSDARKFLSGKDSLLADDLEDRMRESAAKQDFERAKVLRDQIHAINSLQEKQRMERSKDFDQDIVGFVSDGETVRLAVFSAKKGVLSGKDEFEFGFREGFFEEFLLQYYSQATVPREIIVPEEVPESLVDLLSDLRGGKVELTVPVRGEKKDLLDLVKKNVESHFLESELSMQDLQEKLGLENKPRRIECFDISHTAGTDPVGSMVSFLDAKPDKSNYRRFKIKDVSGIDDFRMIAEVVRRRYSRIKREDKDFPDLIVIDGGKIQLSFAFEELRKLRLRIPIIALAKKHEEVYFPGFPDPERFERKSRAVKLLQNVRDEAHRFAISYHKLLRKKRVLK